MLTIYLQFYHKQQSILSLTIDNYRVFLDMQNGIGNGASSPTLVSEGQSRTLFPM